MTFERMTLERDNLSFRVHMHARPGPNPYTNLPTHRRAAQRTTVQWGTSPCYRQPAPGYHRLARVRIDAVLDAEIFNVIAVLSEVDLYSS